MVNYICSLCNGVVDVCEGCDENLEEKDREIYCCPSGHFCTLACYTEDMVSHGRVAKVLEVE